MLRNATRPLGSGHMNPTDIVAAIPFAVATGIELVSATPDEAVGTLEWSGARTTTGGAMHGGAIMTLADTIGAVCAFLNLPSLPKHATATESWSRR